MIMKKQLFFLCLFISGLMQAQQDCKLTTETTEDGRVIQTTEDYMVYEKIFGGSSQFIFLSLTNSGGTPLLNFQHLAKSNEFPQLYCFDKNSKIHIQLTNGKVVTLINGTDDECGNLLYNGEEKKNIRILSGTFLFTKGSLEELQKSTITFIRVNYTTGSVDYPIRGMINSETTKQQYYPEKYFMNFIKCL